MRYDLFFTSPNIPEADFNAYFAGRPFYELTSGQAFYTNQETGVYFSFEYSEPESEGGEEPGGSVAFNMNYYRPHYFALEAESEVTRFVGYFGCSIYDPQMDGMEEGPYSPEGFIKGWNAGNAFGYRAVLKSNKDQPPPFTKKTAELEAAWLWNFHRQKQQEDFGDDIFLPKIWYGLIDGVFGSITMWPDAISCLFPEADFYHIPRKEMAPSRFLRGKQEDFCIVAKEDLPPELFESFKTHELGCSAYRLPRPEVGKSLTDFVRSLKAFKGQIEGVGSDSVLNIELVDQGDDQS